MSAVRRLATAPHTQTVKIWVPAGSEKLWRALLSYEHHGQSFAAADVAAMLDVSERAVETYLETLRLGHHVVRIGQGPGGVAVYRMLRRAEQPPLVSAVDTLRDHIWRAVKMLRHFTLKDIQVHVPDVSWQAIKSYIDDLWQAGYVKRAGDATPPAWRLAPGVTLGPLAPRPCVARFLFDPNTGLVANATLMAREAAR